MPSDTPHEISTRGIPTIDLGESCAVVISAIHDACTSHGFFQIIGHDIDRAVIDHAWTAARRFFDLAPADRMAAARCAPGDAYGYVPFQAEALERSRTGAVSTSAAGDSVFLPDLKQTFNIGPVDPLGREVHDAGEAWAFAASPWPPALPSLRPAWEVYFRAMLGLSGRLMSYFALALELPADHFDTLIDESPSALRAIDYPHQGPHQEPARADGALRAGAHTDYGTLTILRQDAAPGGLQVFDRHSNGWLDVPNVVDAFVVNLGDLMERWTNDRWRSTLHRVVNPSHDAVGSTRRQSMAFFHNANYAATIECLPTCLAPGESPRHPTVLAGPHLQEKYLRATS